MESASPGKKSPDSNPPQSRPSRLLVVDDDPSFASMVQDFLLDYDYQVAICMDGPSCLEYCQTLVPDLILLDILMPGMDGFDVCAALKKEEVTAGIPIMLLSGLDDPEHKIMGFSLGVFDYLTKPFKNEELLARIQNILGRQQLLVKTVQESKVDTLRQLSVTLADRITNPLSSILACCQLVSRHIDNRERVIDIINTLKESVDEIYAVLLKLTSAERVESARYCQDIDMIDVEELSSNPPPENSET